MSTHCMVQDCKTSIFNKLPGVTLHPCPTSSEMRTKWLQILRNKCTILDWSKSKICSKHFERRCFDSQRKLVESALPTLFYNKASKVKMITSPIRINLDRHLKQKTQSELIVDIKNHMNQLKEPYNLPDFVTDDLKLKPEAPLEAKLWLIIKKQEHLNTRLIETMSKNKKEVEALQKDIEECKTAKNELEKSIDTYKYIVKSLQDKHATLEEQIEILTAIESR